MQMTASNPPGGETMSSCRLSQGGGQSKVLPVPQHEVLGEEDEGAEGGLSLCAGRGGERGDD